MADVVVIARNGSADPQVRVWARQHEHTIVKVVPPDVDQLGRVCDDVRAAGVAGAVVSTLDVLGDVLDQEAFRAVFGKVGGTLHVVDQEDADELAAGDGIRQLVRDALDRMQALQGYVFGARLTRGSTRRREATGRSGGRAAFGWKFVAGELVEDLREQAVRRRMKELRDRGYGFSAIARRVAEEGYLKRDGGSNWHPDMVRRILMRDGEDGQRAS
ncbi:recombinase family protein [Streptomyces laurentii]|uniref:recombinase family protein n=1 Tax=Streptomyces laurentii TaxID=39478 RepID=UPI0036B98EA1